MSPLTWCRLGSLLALGLLLPACANEYDVDTPGRLVPMTVTEDASLPAVDLAGVRIHAEAFGPRDSALVIVLHGGPGADYRYLLNCRDLAEDGFRVVFYDQRGAGLSERLDADTYRDLQPQFDDLTGIIAHYRTSPRQHVFLLGHSWGAMLAGAYVDRYPPGGDATHQVDGLVLAEPGGFAWPDIAGYIQRSQSAKLTSELFNDSVYPGQFLIGRENQHTLLDYQFALLAAGDNDPSRPTGNPTDVRPSFWRYGAVTQRELLAFGERTEPDWRTGLGRYTAPVLFLYSERNRAYGLGHATTVASAFPAAELLLVRGEGHEMLSYPTGWQQARPAIAAYLRSR